MRHPLLHVESIAKSPRQYLTSIGEVFAVFDAWTTVYTMGRTAVVLLGDGTMARAPFRGNDRLYPVISHACV